MRGSGRVLEVVEAGDMDGLPVFSLHGSPGSRLLFQPHVDDARSRGLRLIGYSRPGYGASTAVRGRRVADVAQDVEAIADELRIRRFAVWGHSGGGAPALACAALLPDRVAAASCLAGAAPYGAPGLDWFDGMGEYNVTDFRLMLSDEGAWREKNRLEGEQLRNGTPETIREMFATLMSEVDNRAFTPELGGYLVSGIREGFRVGIDGLLDDGISQGSQWGFDPAAISVPVQVWHGRHDMFVPFAHGEWLAAHVPDAEVHLEEGEGHLSLFVDRIPEVQGWLASRL